MYRKLNDQEKNKYDKLVSLKSNNNDPYKITKVNITHNLLEFHNDFDKFDKPTLHDMFDNSESMFVVTGRIMNIRQTFGLIKDFYGKLQFYVNKKNVPEDEFKFFNNLDIGDIVKITGIPMKTNTGELTINVKHIQLLSKSLKVMPEKHHGLVDIELRSRERYVDLIINDESMQTFVLRSKIIKSLRNYMDSLNFYEVETPILHPILGGAAAKPFITHHNTLDKNFYLRIAPELYLKRLIVGGFDKVYELGRVFRNEGMDSTHNPEFTALECYQANVGMHEMMDLCESMIKYVVSNCFDKKISFKYRNYDIELNQPFKKIHMLDLINEIVNIDFWKINNIDEAIKLANEHQIKLEKHELTMGHIINAFFEKYCEEKLIQPTFVYGHPKEISPLAKSNIDNDKFTDRFELFIGQKEFANAFAELNDPLDQYDRFEQQLKQKELGDQEASEMDLDYINALEYGLPPTGGLGLGVDRLVMLLTEKDSIRDVLLFPHMKDK